MPLGSIIVPTGYVDYDIIHAAGGNPYGLSNISGDGEPSKDLLTAAKFQGGRLTRIAAALTPLRAV